jgi:hypothetical protein
MKSLIAIYILLISMSAYPQSGLPYDETWNGFPFISSYQRVVQATAVLYEGEKDFRKKRHPIHETMQFDSLGRNTLWTRQDEFELLRACWIYEPNGCPIQVQCDSADQIGLPIFHCNNGRIDTLTGRLTVVRTFDEFGKYVLERRYKSDHSQQGLQLFDSLTVQYDSLGRYTGTVGKAFSIFVKYLEDSIVIEKSVNGQLEWLKEITCGPFGLPIEIVAWTPDDRRKRQIKWYHIFFRYEFR